MNQISFVVNCSNDTLEHMKLLIKSLRENLASKEHEILIFVDSDNEGTADWLKEQKKDFFDLKIITHKVNPCIGYSRNNNLLVELAKHDIVSYLQSDMVISKDYDVHVLEALEDNCILSATRIEPPLHGTSEQTITKDFGTDPNEFKWDEFLAFSAKERKDKNIEFFFAPFTFYKKVWMDVGGYDTLYRRSREDSDLLQRFIQKGVKIKQTFNANVYHFSCVTSRGKNWFDKTNEEAQKRTEIQSHADHIELRRFTRKWGRFNHGEEKLVRYDMDMVWVGGTPQDFFQIELFFPRVWVPNQQVKEQIVEAYKLEHTPANDLLKFSDEDWAKAKQYYNQIDYDKVFQVGEPQDYNIKVTVDMNRNDKGGLLKDANFFLQNIAFLSDMFAQEEPGTYDVGCATVEIKNKVNLAETSIIVTNPPFDHSLLTIE